MDVDERAMCELIGRVALVDLYARLGSRYNESCCVRIMHRFLCRNAFPS